MIIIQALIAATQNSTGAYIHNNGLLTTCLYDKAAVKANYVQAANLYTLVQLHIDVQFIIETSISCCVK